MEYRDIGFSMSLRAFPRTPRNVGKMIYNLLFRRTVYGLVRMTVGQSWNDIKERRAVTKTDALLAVHC